MKYLLVVRDNNVLVYDLDKQALFWQSEFSSIHSIVKNIFQVLDEHEDTETFRFHKPSAVSPTEADAITLSRKDALGWARELAQGIADGRLH